MSKLRYIQYSRKSSEAKEKQALSIADQNEECKSYAFENELIISAKFEESKSAFKPGKREYFKEMIRLIKEGELNAILTWKEDRLCRNPEEGGMILQLLQDGVLKEIRCVSSNAIYTPDSDHLILQIHFGMANSYSRNLSQNVRRGYRRKIIDRKQYPYPAPIGYEGFGDRGNRDIQPHPLYARLVTRAFEMASEGRYSLSYISKTLTAEGLRTRRGNGVGKSHIQMILKSPVYYGQFYNRGELFEGKYEPLISKGLYDLVQEKLKDRSKPKNVNWEREFAGLIKCGGCGCAITTTVKRKFVKKNKDFVNYVYHHCTRRRGECIEKGLTDSELKDVLYKSLDQISIDKEVWSLGIKLLQEKHKAEIEKNKNQLQYINQQQHSIRDQINRLIDMRASEELTKEEFIEQKNRLLGRLSSLTNKANDNEHSVKTWLELAEQFFNTAFQARDIVESGTTEQKQKILRAIGENFLLKDKMLTFSFRKPYDVLLITDVRSDVLPSRDSNPNKRIQNPLSYH